jgi:hypothetical protein
MRAVVKSRQCATFKAFPARSIASDVNSIGNRNSSAIAVAFRDRERRCAAGGSCRNYMIYKIKA